MRFSREANMASTSERVQLLAMCKVPDVSWNFVAREAQRRGLDPLLAGSTSEDSTDAQRTVVALRAAKSSEDERRAVVTEIIAKAKSGGIHLTTVIDDDYPANLRLIYNLPPFLFYRGQLQPDDARSVAVVGTRGPTPEGLRRARRLAGGLAAAGVTVLSGLARGIDSAAHEACLEKGGRTIAVLGSGLNHIYPPENESLAERIGERGAVVSQFWPDRPPTRDGFPRRNIVMSGLGQGTVVVEASSTSGAKMQARYALEHGKKLFLLSSLVKEREWARGYMKRGAVEVSDPSDIIRLLSESTAIEQRAERRLQLSLTLD
jgi:DNA processing protein